MDQKTENPGAGRTATGAKPFEKSLGGQYYNSSDDSAQHKSLRALPPLDPSVLDEFVKLLDRAGERATRNRVPGNVVSLAEFRAARCGTGVR